MKVKDKEIRHLARDLKSRNKVIKELGDRLIETAEAAESTASSVHVVHKRYQESLSEVDRLRRQLAQAVKQVTHFQTAAKDSASTIHSDFVFEYSLHPCSSLPKA